MKNQNYELNDYGTKFKRQFYIFKKDRTLDGNVCIISLENEDFNYTKKVNMYLSLGYEVYNLDGKKYKNLI
jgi:hypothetical protein